jgi:hypothetical protein
MIGPRDTTAPSAVTWKASYGRLGTGRLGTIITSIYFVVGPSQCQGTPAAYPPVTGQGHLNGCGSAKAG